MENNNKQTKEQNSKQQSNFDEPYQFLVFRDTQSQQLNQYSYEKCLKQYKINKNKFELSLWLNKKKIFNDSELEFFKNYMIRARKSNKILEDNIKKRDISNYKEFMDTSKSIIVPLYWQMIYSLFEKMLDQKLRNLYLNCAIFLNNIDNNFNQFSNIDNNNQNYNYNHFQNNILNNNNNNLDYINMNCIQIALGINCTASYYCKLRENQKYKDYHQIKITYIQIEKSIDPLINQMTQDILYQGIYKSEYSSDLKNTIQYIAIPLIQFGKESQIHNNNNYNTDNKNILRNNINNNNIMRNNYVLDQSNEENNMDDINQDKINFQNNIDVALKQIQEFKSDLVVISYSFDLEDLLNEFDSQLSQNNYQSQQLYQYQDERIFNLQQFKYFIETLCQLTNENVIFISNSQNNYLEQKMSILKYNSNQSEKYIQNYVNNYQNQISEKLSELIQIMSNKQRNNNVENIVLDLSSNINDHINQSNKNNIIMQEFPSNIQNNENYNNNNNDVQNKQKCIYEKQPYQENKEQEIIQQLEEQEEERDKIENQADAIQKYSKNQQNQQKLQLNIYSEIYSQTNANNQNLYSNQNQQSINNGEGWVNQNIIPQESKINFQNLQGFTLESQQKINNAQINKGNLDSGLRDGIIKRGIISGDIDDEEEESNNQNNNKNNINNNDQQKSSRDIIEKQRDNDSHQDNYNYNQNNNNSNHDLNNNNQNNNPNNDNIIEQIQSADINETQNINQKIFNRLNEMPCQFRIYKNTNYGILRYYSQEQFKEENIFFNAYPPQPKKDEKPMQLTCNTINACMRVVNENEIQIYLTISKECQEMNQSNPQLNINSIYTIKFSLFDDKSQLKFQEFGYVSQSQKEIAYRNITCDDNYIYLLNGQKEVTQEISKGENQTYLIDVKDCERINIFNGQSEQIAECEPLKIDLKTPIFIHTTNDTIFYAGIKINQDLNESITSVQMLIVQIYSKSKNQWFSYKQSISINCTYFFSQGQNEYSFYLFTSKSKKKQFFEIKFFEDVLNNQFKSRNLGTLDLLLQGLDNILPNNNIPQTIFKYNGATIEEIFFLDLLKEQQEKKQQEKMLNQEKELQMSQQQS